MTSILEIIELRSVIKNKHEVISLIEGLLENEINKTDVDIKIFTHSTFITDYSVHLYYQVDDKELKESNLGYELSANLSEYGLISHNTWIEKKKGIKGEK